VSAPGPASPRRAGGVSLVQHTPVRAHPALSKAPVYSAPVLLGLSLDPRDLIESLSPYAELGVMAIVFAETGLLIGFFLPGDSLLFTAGLLAGQGRLDISLLLTGCFPAAVLGDQFGYYIGQRAGPALFRRPDSRLFRHEFVERTKRFFERHGPKTIVLARFVPVVRTFAPVLAGVGQMPYRTFVGFNVVGALLWAVGVTLLGYLLGDVIGDNIDTYLYPIIAVIILASLVPPLLEWRRHRRASAASDTIDESTALSELLDDPVDD
jgi:membrane-associated protein